MSKNEIERGREREIGKGRERDRQREGVSFLISTRSSSRDRQLQRVDAPRLICSYSCTMAVMSLCLIAQRSKNSNKSSLILG
ncbi:unnamed protein product [Pleuronectes platessa]|uniref:Uncharacterized protein n=1 Tax=Pleuronectes platessa TaxID=8262 RepID=A0A9N7VE07_PLEPL|nr:unnamed protein product [Pleuronectes platessa]